MTSPKRQDYDWGYMIWWLDGYCDQGPDMSTAKMVVHPGKTSENHLHDNCYEFLVVAIGTIEAVVDGVSTTLVKDETLLIGPNSHHYVKNGSDVDAELTIIYSASTRNYAPV